MLKKEMPIQDLYKVRIETAERTARLFARAIRHRRECRGSEFSRIGWE